MYMELEGYASQAVFFFVNQISVTCFKASLSLFWCGVCGQDCYDGTSCFCVLSLPDNCATKSLVSPQSWRVLT